MIIDKVQLWMIYPRIIEIFIFMTCAFILYKKFNKISINKYNRALGNIYLHIFVFWSIGIFFELLFNLISGFSIDINSLSTLNTENFPIVVNGYDQTYPSLFIANIFRDIQGTFMLISAYLTYKSVKIIQFGVELGSKKSKNPLILIIFFILFIVLVFSELISIEIYSSSKIIVQPRIDIVFPIWVFFIGYLIYSLIYLYCLLITTKVLIENYFNINKEIRLQMLFFNLGYLFLFLGLLWWSININHTIITNELLYQIVGHILWTISPIFFYLAFTNRIILKKIKNNLIKNN